MDKNLQDFCIKNNIPFTVEFKKPWYPKPIEVSLKRCNSVGDIELIMKDVSDQALLDSIVYGTVVFHISDD